MAQNKKKIFNIFIILLSFCGFVYIMSMVPYGSDDWAWGASVGQHRLATHFANYNGRYLGNLLILLLMKSDFCKTAGMAIVAFSVVYLMYKYVGRGRLFYFLFILALLFMMPSNIYRQTMGWASGLANYIPPVAFTLLYLAVVKNVFEKDAPKYSKWLIPLSFFIGVCGNLFMEHVTLMNIVVSIGVIVYAYIKFKSFFAVHIWNFIGNAAGAAIMFSNSAYGIIASGDDDYRGIAQQESFFKWLTGSIDRVCTRSVESNVYINVLISLMLLIVVIHTARAGGIKKWQRNTAVSLVVFDIAYSVFVIVKEYGKVKPSAYATPTMSIIRCVLATIFIASLIIIPLITFEDKDRGFKCVIPILAECVLIVPLLVVSPVTGRCFYPPYVMFMLYSCELMTFIADAYSNIKILKNAMYVLVIAGVIAGSVFYISTYNKIADFDEERTQYVYTQIEEGKTTVYLPHFPSKLELYTEGTNPDLFKWYSIWEERYKDFYNIDEDITVQPISYSRYVSMKKLMNSN